MQSTISTGTLASNLLVYGSVHALTDATCGAVVFAILTADGLSGGEPYYLVLTYSLLAFGFQPFFGRLVDHWRTPRYERPPSKCSDGMPNSSRAAAQRPCLGISMRGGWF
jgi:hypothetical protein